MNERHAYAGDLSDGQFAVIERFIRLRGDLRKASGRERMPSAGIIDSQSVKTTEKGGRMAMMADTLVVSLNGFSSCAIEARLGWKLSNEPTMSEDSKSCQNAGLSSGLLGGLGVGVSCLKFLLLREEYVLSGSFVWPDWRFAYKS